MQKLKSIEWTGIALWHNGFVNGHPVVTVWFNEVDKQWRGMCQGRLTDDCADEETAKRAVERLYEDFVKSLFEEDPP